MKLHDVIIAGAGVIGAFVARELSRYDLKICILEKGNDVASGSSKANSGIVHAGYDCSPGSLKAMLNVRGAELMEDVVRELDVPYKRTGSLVVGFGEKDRELLEGLMKKGIANGVRGLELLDRDRVKELEPQISDEVTHALFAPTAGIICPYELTVAAVENAVVNGVELRRNCRVTSIGFKEDHIEVVAGGELLSCRYFVNAAGVNSDKVAALAGDKSFAIIPRKGEYLLMDKVVGNLVNRVVFQCPTALGKGILVTPTVDGNIMVGPDAQDIDDRDDNSTTAAGIRHVLQGGIRAVPDIEPGRVITSFAGLRARLAAGGETEASAGSEMYLAADKDARSRGDFLIQASKVNPNFINVAGIDSPGLSCAPAIGEYVSEILGKQGLERIPRKDFIKNREKVIRFREIEGEELDQLLKKKPAYGRLVCRCEKVTEGEVVDSIRRPAGALDLDAVKRRTRAGMGRCQGGFCTPRLVELLSRELGIPYDKVTKKGEGSWMLSDRIK
jgi:glycerol-3-phosphate dehydrogenase